MSAFERKFLAAQEQAARDDEAQRLADAAREEQLIAEMAAVEGGFASLASASNVGSLMGMQDVSAAAAAYEAEQEKLKRMLEALEKEGDLVAGANRPKKKLGLKATGMTARLGVSAIRKRVANF